ncbi:hypothetical protein ThesuDRAFT_00078 [Thermaerobacter subterraneus DSM 13965]|uniref:Uncharacterized protein n=1 Tax=Thermaerobacter subterraneus DSM 13965 TaxID=867903 RepID=K6PZ35_9FIRM|nr:hypothetical protein ThesuDRAFT_00078 [Thermaerobacter subterraneus DSM 13965]
MRGQPAASPPAGLDCHLARTVIPSVPSRAGNSLGVFPGGSPVLPSPFSRPGFRASLPARGPSGTGGRPASSTRPTQGGLRCTRSSRMQVHTPCRSGACKSNRPRPWASAGSGSTPACHCRSPRPLNSQQRPPTGRRQPPPGTSSMCPYGGFLGPPSEARVPTRILRHPQTKVVKDESCKTWSCRPVLQCKACSKPIVSQSPPTATGPVRGRCPAPRPITPRRAAGRLRYHGRAAAARTFRRRRHHSLPGAAVRASPVRRPRRTGDLAVSTPAPAVSAGAPAGPGPARPAGRRGRPGARGWPRRAPSPPPPAAGPPPDPPGRAP